MVAAAAGSAKLRGQAPSMGLPPLLSRPPGTPDPSSAQSRLRHSHHASGHSAGIRCRTRTQVPRSLTVPGDVPGDVRYAGAHCGCQQLKLAVVGALVGLRNHATAGLVVVSDVRIGETPAIPPAPARDLGARGVHRDDHLAGVVHPPVASVESQEAAKVSPFSVPRCGPSKRPCHGRSLPSSVIAW